MAGTVELAEIYALPLTEDQIALLDQHDRAISDQGSFDVAIAVSFGVAVVCLAMGNQFGEFLEQIVLHIRVGVFVDGDGGGSWRCPFVVSSEHGKLQRLTETSSLPMTIRSVMLSTIRCFSSRSSDGHRP